MVPNLDSAVTNLQISPVYVADGSSISVGHVQTIFTDGGFTATNITQLDHLLCCGSVTIRNVDYDGFWFAYAHGDGSNYYGMGWVNQVFGKGIFYGLLSTYSSVVRSKVKAAGGY